MFGSMAPLHSLVDGLSIKNRCRQKEGVTLRPQYLKENKKFQTKSHVELEDNSILFAT